MNSKINRGLKAVVLLAAFVLSACGAAIPTDDPAVKITQIAATVQAEFTQNAALTPSATPTLAATATPTMRPPTATPNVTKVTPIPTATTRVSVQGNTDDKAVYVADDTIPDGTIVKPGSTFVKTWSIRNTGTTTWETAYRLSYMDGIRDAKETLYVHLPNQVKPALSVNVSVTFTAPSNEGTYYSYWRLVNSDGIIFGEVMSMRIVVGNP
ncbi:MAG: NBR1-Ig-like domain-containing protein [Chloroflexi bacterium]|nr:NBR1-Ig-like domain-containing protein [Chloroflexota bacterium]